MGAIGALVSPELDRYIRDLLPPRDTILAEMERQAEERRIPIVGPAVATLLATLARSIGARGIEGQVCENVSSPLMGLKKTRNSSSIRKTTFSQT